MALNVVEVCKGIAANAKNAAGLEDAKHYQTITDFGGVTFTTRVDAMDRSAQGGTAWTIRVVGELRIRGTYDRAYEERMQTLLPLVWTAIEGDLTANGFANTLQVVAATVARDRDEVPVGVDYEISVEVI